MQDQKPKVIINLPQANPEQGDSDHFFAQFQKQHSEIAGLLRDLTAVQNELTAIQNGKFVTAVNESKATLEALKKLTPKLNQLGDKLDGLYAQGDETLAAMGMGEDSPARQLFIEERQNFENRIDNTITLAEQLEHAQTRPERASAALKTEKAQDVFNLDAAFDDQKKKALLAKMHFGALKREVQNIADNQKMPKNKALDEISRLLGDYTENAIDLRATSSKIRLAILNAPKSLDKKTAADKIDSISDITGGVMKEVLTLILNTREKLLQGEPEVAPKAAEAARPKNTAREDWGAEAAEAIAKYDKTMARTAYPVQETIADMDLQKAIDTAPGMGSTRVPSKAGPVGGYGLNKPNTQATTESHGPEMPETISPELIMAKIAELQNLENRIMNSYGTGKNAVVTIEFAKDPETGLPSTTEIAGMKHKEGFFAGLGRLGRAALGRLNADEMRVDMHINEYNEKLAEIKNLKTLAKVAYDETRIMRPTISTANQSIMERIENRRMEAGRPNQAEIIKPYNYAGIDNWLKSGDESGDSLTSQHEIEMQMAKNYELKASKLHEVYQDLSEPNSKITSVEALKIALQQGKLLEDGELMPGENLEKMVTSFGKFNKKNAEIYLIKTLNRLNDLAG